MCISWCVNEMNLQNARCNEEDRQKEIDIYSCDLTCIPATMTLNEVVQSGCPTTIKQVSARCRAEPETDHFEIQTELDATRCGALRYVESCTFLCQF